MSITNHNMPTTLSVSPDERWYVARTQSQRELYASKQLVNQGFRVFVPRYWKNRRHARKTETVLAALFPRYIFVRLDRTKERWRSINGTFGVDRLLTRDGEPQAVPRGVVESLITATAPDGGIRFHFDLKEGQNIRVTAGPFADLVGQLERLDENGRVRILLDLMGGKVRVGLPQTFLAPNEISS
jgi:transcription antitermination factor NusG